VSEKFSTEMHIDTDEGNAAGIKSGDRVKIIGLSDKTSFKEERP